MDTQETELVSSTEIHRSPDSRLGSTVSESYQTVIGEIPDSLIKRALV
jgi:hypothetical protein